MKNHASLAFLFTTAILLAGVSTASAQSRPTVITPLAIKDGSNWSRAPFAAARQFDDVKPADGRAIDQVGANSATTKLEPVVAPAKVAIMQRTPSPTVVSEPVLMPTGRESTPVRR